MRFIKNESGAVTIVEATLIFPFIFFILGFFILTSLYVLQKTSLSADTERAALAISKIKAIPGYDHLGQAISKATDFSEEPSLDSVLDMISTVDPFRYHTSDIHDIEGIYSQFATLVGDDQFITPSQTNYSISCQSNGFNQEIFVEATQEIDLPLFVRVLGFDENLEIQTTALATVCDPAELIRNMEVANELEAIYIAD